MKAWIFISMIVVNFSLYAANIESEAETGPPLNWHFIQVDDDNKENPFDHQYYIDEILIPRYGFSEEEAYQIIAGVSRNPRITYFNKKGTILFSKHHHQEKKHQKESECNCVII